MTVSILFTIFMIVLGFRTYFLAKENYLGTIIALILEFFLIINIYFISLSN